MNFEILQTTKYTQINSKVEKLDASNATELKTELTSLNKSGVNTIVFDLSKTRYCDSSGLSAILMANRMCRDTNGRFILTGLQENVLKMIKIAQLDKVLSIYNSVDEAEKSLY
ncbi:MAG: STAS domain-containing protein [Fluviicola sp.]|jgi:anti-sigma B factor antagonist